MSKIRRTWTLRICLAVVLVAAALTPILWSSADAAIVPIGGPHVCAYYSDATYTTVVGARGTGCCGEVISWGDTSLFRRCERLYCPAVICPQ